MRYQNSDHLTDTPRFKIAIKMCVCTHSTYKCIYKCDPLFLVPSSRKMNNKNNVTKYKTSLKKIQIILGIQSFCEISQAEFLEKNILSIKKVQFFFCGLLIISESYYCLFLLNMRLIKEKKYFQQPSSLEKAYKVNRSKVNIWYFSI